MSHSHNKQRRKIESEKYSSRSNVFERLGEDKKDEENWHAPSSKSAKNRRPNVDVGMDRELLGRKPERWASSSRDKRTDQSTSSKQMKALEKGFHSDYNQDHARREYPGHHQMQDVLPPKKHRPPPEEPYRDDYDRGRKKRERSFSSDESSSSSSSPQYSSKHDRKKLLPMEKDYERGRSKEKKNKKVKEALKYKEQPKKPKSRSYEAFQETESADYDDTPSDYRHKKRRVADDEYEQTKHIKESRTDQYKQRRQQTKPSASKKVRDIVHATEDSDSSVEKYLEGKHQRRDDVGKSSRSKVHKEEKAYDEPPKAHKKIKSHKVEVYDVEVPKHKKKVKVEKEDRLLQHIKSQEVSKKSRDVFSDRESSQASSTPSRHKSKERKHYKNEILSDEDEGEIVEKKVKTKKKKKQKIIEEMEPVKKKKPKHKTNEQPVSRKKNPDLYEQEELKEKMKKPKKKKRVREESVTSQSEGEIEEPVKPKKRARDEGADQSWSSMDVAKSRDYNKHDDYESSSKNRQSVIVAEPQRKRLKLEPMRRGDSLEGSNRSDSRMKNSSLPRESKRSRDHSQDHDSYDTRLRDDKRVRDEERMYHEHRVQESPMRSRDIDPAFGEPKVEPRHSGKYVQHEQLRDAGRYKENRLDDKKSYYDDEKAARYHKKVPDTSYDEKRSYDPKRGFGDKRGYDDKRGFGDKRGYDDKRGFDENRGYDEKRRYDENRGYDERNQKMRDQPMRYDDASRRESRREIYDAEERKSRNDFRQRDDSRNRSAPHRKQDAYPSQSPEFREFVDSHHGEWQPHRSRKSKDAAQNFNEPHRASSWADGRDGGKMRMETREPQVFRKNRDAPRMDPHKSNPRGDRVDQRDRVDHRIDRLDERVDQRNPRHDPRGERQYDREAREDARNQRRDKWVVERGPIETGDPRRHGKMFNDDRSSSRNRSQIQEERDSPGFYREVRRSGENRHLDLGIEVTIRDDGGRLAVEHDKSRKHRVSPPRKVSSYEPSRLREGASNKPPSERSISLHRDRSGSEPRRMERQMSPHRDVPPPRYPPQHRGGDPMGHGMHGRDDDRGRQRSGDKQHTGPGRNNVGKFAKSDRGRAMERDQSRGSSVPDYQRDLSSSSRDRSRGTPRDTLHPYQRGDGLDRKSSKGRKERESSKSSSDRSRRRSKSSSRRDNSKSGRRKEKNETGAMDVLDVDWTELTSDPSKPQTPQGESGSILKRFKPGNLLIGMGVSSKLLPPELLEKVKTKCQEEVAQNQEAATLVLDHGLGELNRAASLRQSAWRKTFTSHTTRGTSFDDARYRKRILGITEDLLFPPQPPMIINAKSYASSMKHYLTKTKIAVEGG